MDDLFPKIVNKVVILTIVVVTATILLVGVGVIGSIDVSPADFHSSGEVISTEGSIYLDRAGETTAVGEIENDYGEAITDITVIVSFYENGEEVGSVETEPLGAKVGDGQTVPFEAKYSEEGQPDSFSVSVDFTGTSEPAPEFDIEHEESHTAQDSVTVSGTAENTGDGTVERPVALATFYNQEGEVIGARSDRISPDSLEPGETGEFTIRYSTLGDVPSLARDYTDYRIVIVNQQTS
ncbi:FxLYD domain-containing protein [Natronorarus salvus]|uniref:FxLYD domain-containing protein n=1 Tax=Natronorarus salvus TaxID=3117733 RepID=UPI002F26D147